MDFSEGPIYRLVRGVNILVLVAPLISRWVMFCLGMLLQAR